MKQVFAIAGTCVLAAIAAGCSASSGPASPSPSSIADATPSSGVLSATNGGQRLASISISAGKETVTTDAEGAFAFHLAPPGATVPVVISGGSIVRRTTTLGAALSVFRLDGSFELSFYRAFARNGFEQPAALQPIRRWTRAPQVYLRTVDEAGNPIDAVTLDTAAAALTGAAGIWTGGQFALASVTRGTETREGASGWVTVKWANPPAAGRCGLSQVATDGGWIELNYLGPSCSCGGPSRIYPRVVRHELGHAFGYYHTDSPGDVMYGGSIQASTCDLQPSAREQEYARYVYSRPVGNTDPDDDPVAAAAGLRSLSAAVIQP